MELSTTADWLGIVGGLALGTSWLWQFHKWLRAKIASVNESALAGSHLVAELLDQATSPARRADIHAYIQFRCNEIEADHTRQLVRSLAMGFCVVVAGLAMLIIWRLFDFDLIPWLWWLWWLSIANYAAAIVAFCLLLFFGAQLRRLQGSWQEKASHILSERAFRHVP